MNIWIKIFGLVSALIYGAILPFALFLTWLLGNEITWYIMLMSFGIVFVCILFSLLLSFILIKILGE